MNLREQAELDLAATLEDKEHGFGWDCQIDNGAGKTDTFIVQTGDVHLLFDTDTGVPVKNRVAHATIRVSSLLAKGFEMPKRRPAENQNPWIFTFADTAGKSYKFTVADTLPDLTLGLITVVLELLKDAA